MSIRRILLPLTGAAGGDAALATALLAVRRWNAVLAALHVRADGHQIAQMAGEGLPGELIEAMMGAAEREAARREAVARAVFDRFVATHGLAADLAAGQPAAIFVTTTGTGSDQVAQQARLADLTVVPHPARGTDEGSASDALHAVLFDSGRPVLIAPATAPASLGTRICVAWSGTAESAAAVRAGLGWMQGADQVSILHARDYRRRGPSVAALAEYLALHGIAAQPVEFAPVDRDVGAGMLAGCAQAGADLLVMGAYSSSRLRQLILGGVTRHVIESAALPVLMAR